MPTKTTNLDQGSSTLNGDASLLFISSCVCEARIACGFCRDNSCLANQRVGQSGLAVIHMRNDTHGADVIRLVHDLSHLVHGEVRHAGKTVAQNCDRNYLVSMTGAATKSQAQGLCRPCKHEWNKAWISVRRLKNTAPGHSNKKIIRQWNQQPILCWLSCSAKSLVARFGGSRCVTAVNETWINAQQMVGPIGPESFRMAHSQQGFSKMRKRISVTYKLHVGKPSNMDTPVVSTTSVFLFNFVSWVLAHGLFGKHATSCKLLFRGPGYWTATMYKCIGLFEKRIQLKSHPMVHPFFWSTTSSFCGCNYIMFQTNSDARRNIFYWTVYIVYGPSYLYALTPVTCLITDGAAWGGLYRIKWGKHPTNCNVIWICLRLPQKNTFSVLWFHTWKIIEWVWNCLCFFLFGDFFWIHGCIFFMEPAAFWGWKLSFRRFWFLHDCFILIDFSTVFIDF